MRRTMQPSSSRRKFLRGVLAASSGGAPLDAQSVEIAAESLYEAAALAVREFRRHPWSDGIEPGAATRLAIHVKTPTTTYEKSIRQLENWLASSAKSPQDALLKARLRAVPDGK